MRIRDWSSDVCSSVLFAMYRVMEAGILAFLAFSPLACIISAPDRPALARAAGAGYIALALLLWLASRLRSMSLRRQAALGLIVDIAAAVTAVYAISGITTGVSLLLVFNIAAAALFLSLRSSLMLALLAALAMALPHLIAAMAQQSGTLAVQAVMVAVTYLAAAVLT